MQKINQYIGTRDVGALLGVSVGTVQKLVDSGIFRCYLTEGKHRRIHREDVMAYCNNIQKKEINGQEKTNAKLSIVIVRQQPVPDACSQLLQNLDIEWKHITNPLDLTELTVNEHHFFWDGLDTWASHVRLANPQNNRHRHVVFNARAFDAEQKKHLNQQAKVYEYDLSAELIQGYLLGVLSK